VDSTPTPPLFLRLLLYIQKLFSVLQKNQKNSKTASLNASSQGSCNLPSSDNKKKIYFLKRREKKFFFFFFFPSLTATSRSKLETNKFWHLWSFRCLSITP
jgi:hypothetical protein